MARRWDRSRYPENWEAMSQAFRASKNYTCEFCGTPQGTMRVSRSGRWYASWVAAAHKYPNDTRNPHPELLCLCEWCHLIYDAQFQDILAEGEHQARLHAIALEQREEVMPVDRAYGWNEEQDGPFHEALPALDVPVVSGRMVPVCCSCGVQDVSIAFGCCRCGRPVHYQEPMCGGWLLDSWHNEAATENEFWCLDCLVNG